MTVAEALRKAADLIEPKGAWSRGTRFRNSRGVPLSSWEDPSAAVCYCAEGAIEAATGVRYSDAHRAFNTYLEAKCRPGIQIWVWNDALSRTQSEVVAALRDCASQLDFAGVPA